MNDATQPLIELSGATVNYDGVTALDRVSLAVRPGELVALLGTNGAGKTTALKAIFGLATLKTGEVRYEGASLKPQAHRMIRRGVAFVPQGKRVFPHLTVQENLDIGAHFLKDRLVIDYRRDEVLVLFPYLAGKLKVKAGALSGGGQQMLALARGLMAAPKLLLLDEPSLGLAPKVVKEVFTKIQEINQSKKTTIVVVEHSIRSVLSIADRGYVFDKGRVVANDTATRLLEGDILEKVFLGKI